MAEDEQVSSRRGCCLQELVPKVIQRGLRGEGGITSPAARWVACLALHSRGGEKQKPPDQHWGERKRVIGGVICRVMVRRQAYAFLGAVSGISV